ncbi:hypothetical protein Ancab_039020 [Ancistrocladus abbreviatus]
MLVSKTKQAIAISKHIKRYKTSYSLPPQVPKFPANFKPTHLTPFLQPNHLTFSRLLKQRPALFLLKQIHAQVVTQSLSSYPPLISSLIHSYLSCHNLFSAAILFDNYPSYSSSSQPTLLWNLMIRVHSRIQNSLASIKYFARMLAVGRVSRVVPDDYTYTFVVTSCSHQISSVHGEIVHGLIIKNGFELDLFVGNSLINMYCIYGKLDDSHKVFDQMPERDVFSWTSLLGGYSKHGEVDKACEIFVGMPTRNNVSWTVMIAGLVANERYSEALNFFRGMLCDTVVKPNEAVLVCALSACAHLGALDQGNWIHLYMDKSRVPQSPNISTALIDMYAKCGKVDCARRVFNGILKRDVHNFTSLISGLSIHGLGKDAMQVFSQMLAENVKPNEITLLGVLNGCSHSRLVEEGTSIFNNMENLWGLVPKIEHYGCYVDLLARAGHLETAFEVVKTMPMEPDIVVWRALLSACRIHQHVSLGERIIDHVRHLNSCGHKNGQVLLSNLYASLGKWESVVEVRKLIGKRRDTSDLGCSWIEVNGVVHEFHVDDQLHPQIQQIQDKLNEILRKAKLGGYVANTMEVTFDLSEEDREQAVARHSEKLAIAFGLLVTEPGTLIRIVKNLRTCEDCHSALKAISLVCEREIVVRDRSRFHSFKEGKCSCNNYW